MIYQGSYSAAQRDLEREIIPMCRSEGMALAPFGVLGGGNFKTAAQFSEDERRTMFPPSEAHLKLSSVLEHLARKRDTSLTSIALAWAMAKYPWMYPIVGGRTVEHLKANIKALDIWLMEDEVKEIEEACPFERGFPHSMMAPQITSGEITAADCWVIANAGSLDLVEREKPIGVRQHVH